MRRQRIIMGTGVTIDIPGLVDDRLIQKIFNQLVKIDNRFSPYKENSEVSKYSRGEVSEFRLSRDLKRIIKACKSAELATNGVFSAWASGSFDPSGYVKGWAIAQAAKKIKKSGRTNFSISIGGDILTSSGGEKVWNIGIQHPANKDTVLQVLKVKNAAVATSGNYERGAHIINPRTKKAASTIKSVTVVGPDIVTADILATTAFVLGKFGLNFINTEAKGYDALIIDNQGGMTQTAGFGDYLE